MWKTAYIRKIFVMKISLQNKKKKRIYRTYSSERPRRSFNFRCSKEGGGRRYLFEAGTLSKEALIKYIKKTSKYFRLVYFRLVIIIEA